MTVFNQLPAGHVTFLVREDGFVPHLRRGEYAVVDTGDVEPTHGEIFVVQWHGGERRRAVVQARADQLRLGQDQEPGLVWWLADLIRFPGPEEIEAIQAAARARGTIPVLGGLSEGPFRTDHLRQRLLGRVVGVAFSPLEEELAPAAGYEDEDAGNREFDPVSFIDVLLATDHHPMVMVDAAGRVTAYIEKFPERRLAKWERQILDQAHRKRVRASTALARIKAECLRRGLVGGASGFPRRSQGRG